jgi:uncharacterized protein YifN (PemK superfamily)
LVVPLSTEAPAVVRGYHHRITAGTYPFLDPGSDSWAKGDLVEAASWSRLDRVKIAGRFSPASLNAADLKAVQACVLDILGLSRLTPHL